MNDHKTNEEIRKKLNTYKLNYINVDYRHKWTQHLLRMNDTCIPRLVYVYIPIGRRNVG